MVNPTGDWHGGTATRRRAGNPETKADDSALIEARSLATEDAPELALAIPGLTTIRRLARGLRVPPRTLIEAEGEV